MAERKNNNNNNWVMVNELQPVEKEKKKK